MAREGNIHALKIEFGKDDRVIIHVPYNLAFLVLPIVGWALLTSFYSQ